MKIDRKDNGDIEVNFSSTAMSYLALVGTIGCIAGMVYFFVMEGSHIFSFQIIGLVTAGVFLGIASIILYEKSHFEFKQEPSELVWEKTRYFRSKRGVIPFHDIKSVKISKDDESKDFKNMKVEIETTRMRLSMTESYIESVDFNVEELVGDLKSMTGLGIDVSPKNRAQILLELGQTQAAIDIIRQEMDMSMEDARVYLGV